MLDFHFHKQLHTAQGVQAWEVQGKLSKGALLGVYGASGAGKTTLLRLLAGLDQAQGGYLKVEEEYWYDAANSVQWSPQKRRVGFVFQDYALFPNMTVRAHLEFATKNAALIERLLLATDLLKLEQQRPHQLSGGQRQRLALARALALEPALLLLDEPLSALDGPLRQQLQALLAELHQAWECTTILVSHDVDEILRLADCLLVIEEGKAFWYDQPMLYFEEQGLAVQLLARILAIEDTNALVHLGGQQLKIPITPQQKQQLQVGGDLKLGAVHSFQILGK
ncbi:MAG: ATP-binding cassette domain-containing protein [Aureispira sp.]